MTGEHYIAPLISDKNVQPVSKKYYRVACLFLFIVSLYILYNFVFLIGHFTRGVAEALSAGVIVPAAIVSGQVVTYHSVAELTNGIMLESADESHHDAFAVALSRSIKNAAVASLASKLNVDQPSIEDGSDSESEFERDFVQKPMLLALATEQAIFADEAYQQEPRNQLLDLKTRIDGGMPFTDAAKKFSEDVTGGNGGDLGVYLLGQIPVWLASAVENDYGTVSDIISGPDAYWLITVYEHGGTEAEPWVRLAGIAIKKKTLGEVVADALKVDPPWVFVW